MYLFLLLPTGIIELGLCCLLSARICIVSFLRNTIYHYHYIFINIYMYLYNI